MNGQGIEGVTIAQFEQWREGVSDSMRYNSLWAIKSYLKWAGVEHPLLKHTVIRNLPAPQPYIKPDEVLAHIKLCNTASIKGLQDATIVAFLWETWARADGLLNVKLAHVDLIDQEITVANKGGGYYNAGFGPDLKDLLERWIRERELIAKCDSLFINVRRGTALTYGGLRSILEHLTDQTGIHATPHDFRRGAATHYANQGGCDRLGMVQGNWRSHGMYERYTRSASLQGFKVKRWMS